MRSRSDGGKQWGGKDQCRELLARSYAPLVRAFSQLVLKFEKLPMNPVKASGELCFEGLIWRGFHGC